ncbi:hypothetical protein CJF30_00008173 [Rutstroemia sp. NJR-2017a BBW]|nr:hypothetical protein CJF30_00008173 [Rutstroemia sp. NJR-2017a BBW]
MERRDSNASDATFISLQQRNKLLIYRLVPRLEGRRRWDLVAHMALHITRYSSYTFTIFGAMHITNTSLIPLLTRSIPVSDSYLLLTRPYYQSFPFEPLLIGAPLIAHITSGIALRIYRRSVAQKRYSSYQATSRSILSFFQPKTWPVLSNISLGGYLLAPLVFSHIFVNRIIPLIHEGSSSGVGLGYVAHGFAKHPIVSWTTYVALVGIGTGHMIWGAAKWFNLTPTTGTDKEKRRRKRRINGVVGAVAGIWMSGGLGVVARSGPEPGWIGRGYDALFEKVPLLR